MGRLLLPGARPSPDLRRRRPSGPLALAQRDAWRRPDQDHLERHVPPRRDHRRHAARLPPHLGDLAPSGEPGISGADGTKAEPSVSEVCQSRASVLVPFRGNPDTQGCGRFGNPSWTKGKMVPPDRIELSTSALPRMRSTTELRRHQATKRRCAGLWPGRPDERRADRARLKARFRGRGQGVAGGQTPLSSAGEYRQTPDGRLALRGPLPACTIRSPRP